MSGAATSGAISNCGKDSVEEGWRPRAQEAQTQRPGKDGKAGFDRFVGSGRPRYEVTATANPALILGTVVPALVPPATGPRRTNSPPPSLSPAVHGPRVCLIRSKASEGHSVP
jgi:hypothetical protein